MQSTRCSCRELRIYEQAPCAISQLHLQFPGIQCPLLIVIGNSHAHGAYIHTCRQIPFYLKLLESTRAAFLSAGCLSANALRPLLPHLPPTGCVLAFPSSPGYCGAGSLPTESVAFIGSGLPSILICRLLPAF